MRGPGLFVSAEGGTPGMRALGMYLGEPHGIFTQKVTISTKNIFSWEKLKMVENLTESGRMSGKKAVCSDLLPLTTSEDTDMSGKILTHKYLNTHFSYLPEGLLRVKFPYSFHHNALKIGDILTPHIDKPSGHKVAVIQGRRFAYHRLVFLHRAGWLPNLVDHIDQDPTNNRVENLRDATHGLNLHNREVKGVFVGKCGRIYTSISVDSVNVPLGAYDTEAEARAAYRAASIMYYRTDSPYWEVSESETP